MVHLSGEIHTKSSRTRRRFRRQVLDRVRSVLRKEETGASIEEHEGRVHVVGDVREELAVRLANIFGVHRITRVEPIRFDALEDLADAVYERSADRVRDRIFAARVRRRGRHRWSSEEAQRAIGGKLYPLARGVDLKKPEVEIQVEVYGNLAYLLTDVWRGPSGLPAGSQDKSLRLHALPDREQTSIIKCHLSQQVPGAQLKAAKTAIKKLKSFRCNRIRPEEVSQGMDIETAGVTRTGLKQVIILRAIQVFLDHHASGHPRRVKLANHQFGTGSTVGHVGGHSQQLIISNPDSPALKW